MVVINHAAQSSEDWREGVATRMRVSSANGAFQLCIFEQWCDPGLGAPPHLHAVEEVLEVVTGAAEIRCGDRTFALSADQSVIIPAGRVHGFTNTGQDTLHVRATLAAPMFEASYEHTNEISRRWNRENA